MVPTELKQYIQEARATGMADQQILQELFKVGWKMRDLETLIMESRPQAANFPIISVRNVSKSYGKVHALKEVNLDIPAGGVTALLGPNGAGKTTLVRILATLLEPTSGEAIVAGLNVATHAQQLRSVIGLTGQYAAVDEVLTGRENLLMVARLYHLSKSDAKKRAQELLRQFELEDAADRTLQTYSGGMRRRLDLAASIIIKPKVLFLDEPTTGLDPRSRFTMWNVIRDLVAQGTTVLLTTQYLEEADQLADKIFVIDQGKIISQGTADELKNQVGGDILEIHLADHSQANRAAELIWNLGEARANNDTGIVTVPVSGGATVLADVIRILDQAGLKLIDIMLRRPSLDDVFMKLTGHVTDETQV